MRIAFAGTPAFAATALQALVGARFDIALVLTQPDRPSGRGLRELPGAVKQLAMQHGLSVEQPPSLRSDEVLARLRASAAQVLVVAAYGLILPPAVLDLFPIGCVNIHASVLPRWRGAAPIQRAILAGDRETGISIMRMERGLDTGPVYLARPAPILPDDTAASLHDRLAMLGAVCIVEALPGIVQGLLVPVAQSSDGITYADKIAKPEAAIDWARDALEVDRQIRAFNPFPGATSMLDGAAIKLQDAHVLIAACAHKMAAGSILDVKNEGIDVAIGDGTLRITRLQKAGGKALPVVDFLRGFEVKPGMRFTAPLEAKPQ